ncbi:hypothetical protein ACPC5U_12815 [Acinetobacter haemolyticus]|uniref:hypothetical protein n=1 Tax=Acinetobacter haemolyticus TaxID=29430 RepID=UPI003C2970CC
MNSAADYRRFADNQALEKAIKAVTDALVKEPFGLEISQIMNNCRLSNRTTKTVLSIIKAENNDGVWSLEGQIQSKNVIETPQTNKVKIMPTQTQNQPEVKATYLNRLIEVFKKHPDGITLSKALEILGGNRSRFDKELSNLRKNHFPVRLENGIYTPEAPIQKIPEPAFQGDISVKNDVQDKLTEFRSMVQKRTVITEEVVLDNVQLDNVLKDVFGLDTIEWFTKDGKVQAHLTKTEVA